MTITRFLLTLLALVLAVATVTAFTQTNYTTTQIYTVPANIYALFIEAWGGGGSGAGGLTSNTGGAGGGGGSYAASVISVTPGTKYNITVGTGGAGSSTTGVFRNGTNSSFDSNSNMLVLAGGGYGMAGYGGTFGGLGGNSSINIGTIKYSGGNGAKGNATGGAPGGGSGGGGAGTTINGGVGNVAVSGSCPGGTGGTLYGGAGGACRTNSDGVGNDGENTSLAKGGGGGGARGPYTGGSGGDGIVRITEYNTSNNDGLVVINIYDASSNTIVSGNTSVLLQNIYTLGVYNDLTIIGVSAVNVLPGIYKIKINNSAYSTSNSILLTVANNTTYNINMYLDTGAQATIFSVTDTLGNIVSNATFSFSRNIGGSVVVYAQGTSDVTSFITVNLNPNYIYSITGTEPTGTYNNFTGLIQPNQAVTYSLKMTFANGGISYPSPYNNTYLNKNATYTNSTKIINVTWEVISSLGIIDYFGLNTTYNGLTYSKNISGSPGGGIAYVNISNVNLTANNTINVSFYFQKNGFNVEYITVPFTFLDVSTGNSSLTGGLFTPPTAPSGVTGRAILGMILLIIIIAEVYKFTNDGAITALVACIIVGVFSINSVALFPKIYGLISVVVGLMVIFGGMINKRT